MDKNYLELPARISIFSYKNVTFPVKNKWGTSLKIVLRNEAKRFPLYRTPVKIEPLVSGRTDTGDIIEIDTLGKWLFGTPGYASNMIVESFEDLVSFRLPDVPEAEELIKQAVDKISKEG